MTRLILPALTIITGLQRMHAIVSCFTVPPSGTSGVPIMRLQRRPLNAVSPNKKNEESSSSWEEDLQGLRQNELIEEEDQYVPSPWEDELQLTIFKRKLEARWRSNFWSKPPRFLSIQRVTIVSLVHGRDGMISSGLFKKTVLTLIPWKVLVSDKLLYI